MDARKKDRIVEVSLTALFQRWTAPDNLRRNSQAMADEFRDIITQVAERGPDDDGDEMELWMGELTEHLVISRRTRVWPTVKDMIDAAAWVNDQRHDQRRVAVDVRMAETTLGVSAREKLAAEVAKQIKLGATISEFHIYGQVADDMVKHEFVTLADLAPYRKSAYMKRKLLHGEGGAEWAARWVAEQEAKTHIAVQIAGDRAAAHDELPPGDR